MIMVAGVPLQLFLAAVFWFVLGVSLSGAWSHPRPKVEPIDDHGSNSDCA